MSADVEFTLLPALPLPGLTAHQALVVEYTWLSMAIIIVSLIAVIVSLKTVPRGLQNAFELIVSFIEGYITDIMGEKGLRYFPLVITAFTFILVANYVGLIPGFISPTANISTTAGWAIVVFIFYQYVGVSKKGLKYFKHFLGPVPAMAPFMVIMETISEFARPFSLAVRLFANIFGGETHYRAALRHTRHRTSGCMDDVGQLHYHSHTGVYLFPSYHGVSGRSNCGG